MTEPKPPVILSRRVFRAIVSLFALAAVLAVTSILFTVAYVHHENGRQQAAAQKAAVPLCGALLHLSMIKGTHGDSGATYGLNLEYGLQRVYAATNCPAVMKAAR